MYTKHVNLCLDFAIDAKTMPTQRLQWSCSLLLFTNTTHTRTQILFCLHGKKTKIIADRKRTAEVQVDPNSSR